jgi:non-ribosomal peptide synthetase component E (peptide arylation enzyme)
VIDLEREYLAEIAILEAAVGRWMQARAEFIRHIEDATADVVAVAKARLEMAEAEKVLARIGAGIEAEWRRAN